MRVLVLGGTGAMGVHLVHLLSDKGYETVVTTRSHKCSNGKVRYVHGNAHDLEFLQTILREQWDVIVDFMVYETSGFKERVKIILDATSQYIFLSSARVYADSKYHITEISSRLLDISKDKEFLATDEYSLAKARQEDILKSTTKTNWTIIRPYITYGENRLQLGIFEKEEWLYRALHGRTIIIPSEITSKVTTMTYGLNVSDGIMAIIGNTQAFGNTFHITTEDSKTWGNILNIYLEVLEKYLGHKPKVLFQDFEKFLKFHQVAKYQILYDRLFNRQFDNSKIKHNTNKFSFTPMEVGLKKCLDEFLKNPRFKKIDWKAEALKDKQTKEYTPLREIIGLKQKTKYILFRYFI